MRNLGRRLQALEAAAPVENDWPLVLDGMSDVDLYRLEGILDRKEAGTPIEAMPDDDLRFLASIRIVEGETPCRT